jgi:hypothetical protein
LQRDLASLPGSEAAAERRAVENEGQTLARLLGTNRVNLERRVREVARDPRSPLRLRVLPVFDLNEPDHEFLYDEP